MNSALRLTTIVFTAVLALPPLSTRAQTVPSKPVHILAPYSAGSGPDVVLRIVADRLSKTWNQPVLVENRTGANGIIAIDALKKLPADGSSLILLDDSTTTINPFLYAKLSYSPENDLTPIAMLMDGPFAIVVAPTGPFKTLKDLIAYAKQNPGKLSYGVPMGVGHPAHLGMERFKLLTDTDIALVPYKASGTMLTDVAAGTLPMAWSSFPSARAFIQSNTVRVLAVGANARHRNMPNVPTVVEAGGPEGFAVISWIALFGPRGLPREMTLAIAADVAAAQSSTQVAERITGIGYDLVLGGPDKLTEYMRADAKANSELIKQLKLRIE